MYPNNWTIKLGRFSHLGPLLMKASLLPLLLATAVLTAPSPALARSCLPYGPLKVTLSGTLERKSLPDAPSVADTKSGDPTASAFYLKLPSSLCVAASVNTQQAAHAEVRELQLVLDPAQSAHLSGEMHETVRLTGTLSERTTGAQSTLLLLRVEAIDGD
jgi:hypothetical protein